MALAAQSGDLLVELEAIEAVVPGARAEFVGGQFVVNRPVYLHQHTILLVVEFLKAEYLDPDEFALPEVRVQTPDGFIVPDVGVIHDSWLESPTPIGIKDFALVVEVLSDSTEATDRGPKRRLCQAAQVDYWLVEQARELKIVERYGYGGGRFS